MTQNGDAEMNKNRDKIVLESILGGCGFTDLSKQFGVSVAMIREVFYRQVKRVSPELFKNGNPTIKDLRAAGEDIKERVHNRLISEDINTPDIHAQINDAIRLLIDVGYSVTKAS